MKNKWIVFLWLTFISSYTFGQSNTPEISFKSHLKSYVEDTKTIITRPFHFNKKQWITTGVFAAAGIFIITQDKDIDTWLHPYRDKNISNINRYTLDQFGSGVVPLLISGGLFIDGMVNKDNYNQHVALNIVKSFILSSAATEVAKQLFHRHRPIQDNPAQWDGPFSDFHYRSFPSRHASSVFAVASVIAHAYPQHKWVAYTAYTLAGLSSLARIYDQHHYASDVFFGAVLGYYIGETIAKNQFSNSKNIKVSMTGNGVGFVYQF